MYDYHYDLLTYILMNKDNLREVKKHCSNIFKGGIDGGIFNLFYMSPEEMKEELSIKYEEIDIVKNLETVKKSMQKEQLIPENINYIIGIEGLDYLKKIEDIDVLYELGVREIAPVWNNHNKFGTGVRPCKIINKQKGLTPQGKELVHKLIEIGIIIDVSHSDEETFWDIIQECKKHKNQIPKIIASHSNCKAIYNVQRNLDDKQIKAIAEFNRNNRGCNNKTIFIKAKPRKSIHRKHKTHITNNPNPKNTSYCHRWYVILQNKYKLL